MKKIYFSLMMTFIYLVTVNGYIFADDKNVKKIFPKNTIMVDMGLTPSSLVTGGIKGDTFLGAAIQYERQIANNVSAAGRFEYCGMDMTLKDGNTANLASFSAEGHGRYFPGGNIFFLDGMFGYAICNYKDEVMNLTAHYFKWGAKLGWRIGLAQPFKLVLEPVLGYSRAIGENNAESFYLGLGYRF